MATYKGYKGGIRGSLGLGFDFGVLATQGWWPTKRWFLDQRQRGDTDIWQRLGKKEMTKTKTKVVIISYKVQFWRGTQKSGQRGVFIAWGLQSKIKTKSALVLLISNEKNTNTSGGVGSSPWVWLPSKTSWILVPGWGHHLEETCWQVHIKVVSYPARWSFSFILAPLHWSSISDIQGTQKYSAVMCWCWYRRQVINRDLNS